MTTDERPEGGQEGSERTKRRSRPLIVLGVVLMGVGVILFATAVTVRTEAVAVLGLIAAGVGVPCIVLGCIPFGFRLMATGILLLGVAAACAAVLWSATIPRTRGFSGGATVAPPEAALYGFVIAVTGLSGLVCAALGLVRLLGTRRGA